MRSYGDPSSEVGRRRELTDRVISSLKLHPRVRQVGFFGSLESVEPDGWPSDQYSDIDLAVHLDGISDRSFFLELPDVMASVGSVIARSAHVMPDRYVGAYWFDGFSPFHHVDVACFSSDHREGADIDAQYAGMRIMSLWCVTLKRFLRAGETASLVRRAAGDEAESPVLSLAVARELRDLLEYAYRRASVLNGEARVLYVMYDRLLKEMLNS